jgi:DNA-binding transcriptional ArsR family regulator
LITGQRLPPCEDLFNALGNPTRRAILALLAERPRTVTELATVLPISRPAVSQQLKILRNCQVVSSRPLGARRFYRLDPAGILAAVTYLDQLHHEAQRRNSW